MELKFSHSLFETAITDEFVASLMNPDSPTKEVGGLYSNGTGHGLERYLTDCFENGSGILVERDTNRTFMSDGQQTRIAMVDGKLRSHEVIPGMPETVNYAMHIDPSASGINILTDATVGPLYVFTHPEESGIYGHSFLNYGAILASDIRFYRDYGDPSFDILVSDYKEYWHGHQFQHAVCTLDSIFLCNDDIIIEVNLEYLQDISGMIADRDRPLFFDKVAEMDFLLEYSLL